MTINREKKVKDMQRKAVIKHLQLLIKELKNEEREIIEFGENFDIVKDSFGISHFSGNEILTLKTYKKAYYG